MEAEEETVFRNEIRKNLESHNIVEDGNDASKLYKKISLTLNTDSGPDSSLIELGEYKWTFGVCRMGTSLQFQLFADIPSLQFYALYTLAIIHPLHPEQTHCSDRFHLVYVAHLRDIFDLERACDKGFLDTEGNVEVELQIQVFRENVFPPLLVKRYRAELFWTHTRMVDDRCFMFFESTQAYFKSLIEDQNEWSRFCTFIEKSDQISKDQMFWEKEDVIKDVLVKRFFVNGFVTSPLLMEILYYGYKSINANHATAKFVRIEKNRFGLVGDIPSLFNRVVGIEYKPIKVNAPTEEDYESIVKEWGCRIVEISVLEYLFRKKLKVKFTQSELIQTEKKSKKNGKKKQNDDSIAADLVEDTSVLDTVRAKLNELFINAQTKHYVIATTLKNKIDALIVEEKEHVARALKKAVTELYMDAQKKVAALYVEAGEESVRRSRRIIRKFMESYNIVEPGNDVSSIYLKFVLKPKAISGLDPASSLVINLGEYKWTFIVHRTGTSLQFQLFADGDNNPSLEFYALYTLVIIHPLDPGRTDCFDAFSFVRKDYTGDVFGLAAACEIDFLDAEGNVKVELQIQVIGDNIFPPFLERKFQIELFLAHTTDLDNICSTFFEKTKENLKSLVQDKNKWSRFCTFIKKSDQISKDQMFWEKEDVIKDALVKRFFVNGFVTSPLLMEILYNGYKSINANHATAKFVRIEENRFGLVGDIPSLFNRVVGIEYKPIKVNTPTEEDYESIVKEWGCRIVEIFVLDYLFRNKIEVNFTQSELIETEKKSKKNGKKKQNDESIAADLEEDTSFLDRVRALLNYLFMRALEKHEVIATTLKEKIDELIAEHQEEYVACALKKAVTELYVEAQENVVALCVEVEEESVRRSRMIFRNEIRDLFESHNIVEDGNDVSKLYKKTSFTLNTVSGYDSSLIELGEYKWTFMVRRMGTSLQFELFAEIHNNPMLNFYALNTLAIIHPLDYRLTDCSDRFHFVYEARLRDVFDLERAFEKGFLDAEGNVKVELQIQVFGENVENVFPPLLARKFRAELFWTYTHIVDNCCSMFIESTQENLKRLIQDKFEWSRFCTFIKKSDQMFWEKEDVIKDALVKRFFVNGSVTSPLLMEILYNGYKSINANNDTAKFVRIKENRFELVGDISSLFNRVVGIEYKPMKVNTLTEEDYESIVTKLGCMIVEIFVLDYLFREKMKADFTQSELLQSIRSYGENLRDG